MKLEITLINKNGKAGKSLKNIEVDEIAMVKKGMLEVYILTKNPIPVQFKKYTYTDFLLNAITEKELFVVDIPFDKIFYFMIQ